MAGNRGVWQGNNTPINPKKDLKDFGSAGLPYKKQDFITDKPEARADLVDSLTSARQDLKQTYGNKADFNLTGGFGGDHKSVEHTTYGTAVDIVPTKIRNNNGTLVNSVSYADLKTVLERHGFTYIVHDVGKGVHAHAVYHGDYNKYKTQHGTSANNANSSATKTLQSNKQNSDPFNTKEFHEFMQQRQQMLNSDTQSQLGDKIEKQSFLEKNGLEDMHKQYGHLYNDRNFVNNAYGDRLKSLQNEANQNGNITGISNSATAARAWINPNPSPIAMLNPEFENILGQGYNASSVVDNLLNDNSTSLSGADNSMVNAANNYFASLNDSGGGGFWNWFLGAFLHIITFGVYGGGSSTDTSASGYSTSTSIDYNGTTYYGE